MVRINWWPWVSRERYDKGKKAYQVKLADLSIRLVTAGRGRISDNKMSYRRIEVQKDVLVARMKALKKLKERAANLKTEKDRVDSELQSSVALSRVRQGSLAKSADRISELEKIQVDLKLQNALYASMIDDAGTIAEKAEQERLQTKEEKKKMRVELKNKITALNNVGNKRNKKIKDQSKEIKRLIEILEQIR